VRSDAANRGATLAKRIVSEVEVGLRVRGAIASSSRCCMPAGGLRVSELVALTWSDVLPREGGQVQLSHAGVRGVK
jgi:integrase